MIGYLYSIDDLSGQSSIHTNTPYAASLYFEGQKTGGAADNGDSIADGWTEIGLISLDKCIGNTANATPQDATLNQWTQGILGLTGADRDRAYIIANGNRIIQFNHSANQWQNKGAFVTEEIDAINYVDNQTHYADFANAETWAQLRFSVKSIMNIARLPSDNFFVTMPEMQFFGLPDDIINAGEVATVSYLKAEDANGILHDILGRHQTLPHRSASWGSASFRFYIGEINNIATAGTHARQIYFSFQNTNGQMSSPSQTTLNATSASVWSLSLSDMPSTSPTYYELYIYSTSNEKIILSSGYTVM